MNRCVAVLGGSFDPVHNGHIALAQHLVRILRADELRIVPAGNPWQKPPLRASAAHRAAMLARAFDNLAVPVTIDRSELARAGPSYTVETLRALRDELGNDVSVAFLLGADQLQQLSSWRDWLQLFDYAHVCAASRPGAVSAAADLPPAVREQFLTRAATPAQIHSRSCGSTFIDETLSVDISATAIRAALHQGERPTALLPAAVLDYIEQHHLYRN